MNFSTKLQCTFWFHEYKSNQRIFTRKLFVKSKWHTTKIVQTDFFYFSGHRCCGSKRGKRWRKIEVHWSLLRRNSNLRAPNIIKYFWIFSTTSLTLTKMMKRQISLFFNQCCSHLFFLVLLLSSVHLCDCIFEEKTNIP